MHACQHTKYEAFGERDNNQTLTKNAEYVKGAHHLLGTKREWNNEKPSEKEGYSAG